MKKYLFLFSFLFCINNLNRATSPTNVTWSLVDENCGINEEEIIQDRMNTQMQDKNLIMGKVQQQFMGGAKDDYAKTVRDRIEKGGYTSLWQLKDDLASIGYDTDELGINLNSLDVNNMKLSDVENLVGGGIGKNVSSFSSFAKNKDAVRNICKTQTIQKCSNSLSSQIDTNRLSTSIQKCTAERTQGTMEYDTKMEGGTDIVGCFVRPGMGVAPPIPMYPFMANNSMMLWTNRNHPGCQCGPYPCPMGTPIVIPHMTADTGASMDISKMAGINSCFSETFNEYTGDIFSRCMTEEEDMCKKSLEQKMRDIRETAVEKYKESGDKCMIKKEAFEKEFKDEVKKKLEGTKTPNGTIIKNGVVINDPNSSKGDKEFIFQLDNEDMNKITKDMNQCKELLPNIDSKETQKRMEEWCDNYTSKVTTPETLDKWVEEELINLGFEKLFYLKFWKLEMIDKTDAIRRNIIRDKYMENYEYDMEKVLQYAEEAPEIMMSVKEIQKMMAIEYEKEYLKHKVSIDQKYKEYSEEKNRIIQSEEQARRQEQVLFEIRQREEREKSNKMKNLSKKEKEKILLDEIEKMKKKKDIK